MGAAVNMMEAMIRVNERKMRNELAAMKREIRELLEEVENMEQGSDNVEYMQARLLSLSSQMNRGASLNTASRTCREALEAGE